MKRDERRGPGRPASERRRVPMGLRVTPELRDQLLARAEATGRSITQEMELLLEEGLLFEKLLGNGLYEVMKAFDGAGSQFAREWDIDGDWTCNPEAYQFAMHAAVRRLVEGIPGPWDGKAAHAMIEEAFNRAQASRARAAGYQWVVKDEKDEQP